MIYINGRGCYQIDICPWAGSRLDSQRIISNVIKEHTAVNYVAPAGCLTPWRAECNQHSIAPSPLRLGRLISVLPLAGARLWASIRNPFPSLQVQRIPLGPFLPVFKDSLPSPLSYMGLSAQPQWTNMAELAHFCSAPFQAYPRPWPFLSPTLCNRRAIAFPQNPSPSSFII